MSKRLGHTMAPRGKRVYVVLHNGEAFTARFGGKESGYMFFLDSHVKIKTKMVASLRILPTDAKPRIIERAHRN